MKKFIFLIVIVLTLTVNSYCDDKKLSKSINQTTFPVDKNTQNIFRQHEIENEGYVLAKQGLYEEALSKYTQSMDPSDFGEQWDKGMGNAYIKVIYQRQGKFEQALQILNKYPKNEYVARDRSELSVLIKARGIKNNKPIYDYISYLKTKYSKYIPPNGYAVGETDMLIDRLIHLYDYMHDYDSGIAFMDEIIKYHTQHPDKNHRSANAKHVKEYTRVKQAWELDKKTGQHGHLQDVIRTSDVISW